jgi:hypothetical protein
VHTNAARKDVGLGIQRVAERLVVLPDGYPRLFVSGNCINLVREMGMYVWQQRQDDRPVKEEPAKVNDHAMDALRYMVMGLDESYGGVPDVSMRELGL